MAKVARNEKMRLYCSLGDLIRCTDCKKVCRVGDLLAVNGFTIPKNDGTGQVWQQILYFCPCDKVHPKAYDPGKGRLVVTYLGHCELMKR